MINNIIFEGNLVRDPEEKYFPNGSKYAIMVLGNSQKFTKQDGTLAENKCFIEVQIFGKSAEIVMNHLSKGCRVTAQGEVNLQTWQDQGGAKRSKHFIVAKKLSIFSFKQKAEENTIEQKLKNSRIEEVNLNHPQTIDVNISDQELQQLPQAIQEVENV